MAKSRKNTLCGYLTRWLRSPTSFGIWLTVFFLIRRSTVCWSTSSNFRLQKPSNCFSRTNCTEWSSTGQINLSTHSHLRSPRWLPWPFRTKSKRAPLDSEFDRKWQTSRCSRYKISLEDRSATTSAIRITSETSSWSNSLPRTRRDVRQW